MPTTFINAASYAHVALQLLELLGARPSQAPVAVSEDQTTPVRAQAGEKEKICGFANKHPGDSYLRAGHVKHVLS